MAALALEQSTYDRDHRACYAWTIYILKSYMSATLIYKELALTLSVPISPYNKNMKIFSA